MSGHNKWSKVKHVKEAQGAKRGKLFTKLIREITVAARVGGGDIHSNSKLRLAYEKALDESMPKETIERAIKRGVGGLEGQNVEEVIYEGYGPQGIGVLVKCMTDNRNRTVSEVRHAFTRMGGNLGAVGSVAYQFSEKGQFIFAPGTDENRVTEVAIEAGAEDVVVNSDQSIEVITAPEDFIPIKELIEKSGLTPGVAEVTMLPKMKVTLSGETIEKVERLIETLEDLDDVQSVYSNADFSVEG